MRTPGAMDGVMVGPATPPARRPGRPPKRSAVLAGRLAACCWLGLHTLVVATCFSAGGYLAVAWGQGQHAPLAAFVAVATGTAVLYVRLYGSNPGYLDNVGQGGQLRIQPVMARHSGAARPSSLPLL